MPTTANVMILATVDVGSSEITAGMIAATATAPGGMWKRRETVDSGRQPRIISSRAYEKINRVAAAWIASVHDTNAMMTIVSATFEPAWPRAASITAMIGFAFLPLITSAKLGTASTYDSVMKKAVTPPTIRVNCIARGILREGSTTSSATSPQASKP